MIKKISITLFTLIIFLFSISPSLAYEPNSVPNNRFGIHIMDENDLTDAANLINTQGGDWGYVTIVIKETERDHSRWQKVFDEMRRKHLIPIIRLATKPQDDMWEAPRDEEINNWIAFLNSLNWVIKNRYVIIGNEPNHAKEWGGNVSPEEYSNYLKKFSTSLKSANQDFYVISAGLDASAPTSKQTMSESTFIKEMIKTNPDIYNYIDGWNSHSYPNPGFSGKETDRGRGTVSTFDWELSYLKSLGIDKDLPVFITETGWVHEVEDNKDTQKLTNENQLGKKINYTFENVWNDKRIVAVTPFLLNYTAPPFDTFSWKKADGSFYSFYNELKEVPKPKGEPIQEVKGKIIGVFVNPFVIVGSSFSGIVLTQNMGQSIWVSPDISIGNESKNVTIKTEDFGEVEPQKLKLIHISSENFVETGNYKIPFVLEHKGTNISSSYPFEFFVIKPPEVKKTSLFGRILEYLRNKVNF